MRDISCSWHTHLSLEEFVTSILLVHLKNLYDTFRQQNPWEIHLYLFSFWHILRSVVLKWIKVISEITQVTLKRNSPSILVKKQWDVFFKHSLVSTEMLRCCHWAVSEQTASTKRIYEVLISGSLHGVKFVCWANFCLQGVCLLRKQTFQQCIYWTSKKKWIKLRMCVSLYLILQKKLIIYSSLTGIFSVIATSQ